MPDPTSEIIPSLTLRPCSAHRGSCAVIVDAETLLLDPVPAIADCLSRTLWEFGRRQGVDVRWCEIQRCVGLSAFEMLAALLDDADTQGLAAAYSCYRHYYETEGRYRARLRPGCLQFLATLACDPCFELHYVTHIGVDAAAQVLDRYGFYHQVRSIMAPLEPAPPSIRTRLIRHLVGDMDSTTENWAMLSDQAWDLALARRLGMRSIALGFGHASPVLLGAVGVAPVAMNLVDVECQLVQWSGRNAKCSGRPLNRRDD
jgi:phosphoglycolate phosphatase-like HAD superfamily hydrolase